MKLSFKQIKSITFGAVEIWEEPDGIHFAKCTKKQLEFWKSRADWLHKNASATTGVRFDFYTNSRFIKVYAPQGQRHEIKINGALTEQITVSSEGCFEIKLELREKLNRVIIAMPSHVTAGIVCDVELSDGATVKPSVHDNKILFLGDSITQGHASKYDLNSYAYLVSDHFNADSVICGIGGACFEPESIDEINFEPNMVFIAYGTNDFSCLKSAYELEKNCFDYLSKIKELYGYAEIYVISPVWRNDCHINRDVGSFDDACKIIESVAFKLNLNIIKGEKMLNKNMDFMFDDVHPNDLGFAVFAHNLIKELNVIRKFLKRF